MISQKFDREDIELLIYISSNYTVDPQLLMREAEKLKSLGRKHCRMALDLCNSADFVNGTGPHAGRGSGYDRIDRLETEMTDILNSLLRVPRGEERIAFSFARDPRGSRNKPICFQLPDGRSNDFGGEDWRF